MLLLLFAVRRLQIFLPAVRKHVRDIEFLFPLGLNFEVCNYNLTIIIIIFLYYYIFL